MTVLDNKGDFVNEVYSFSERLDDARVSFDTIGQFIDSALVGIRPILELAELENRGSDLIGKFPLLAKIPLNPLHHFAAFMIDGLEQPRKYQFCLFLPLGFRARDEL